MVIAIIVLAIIGCGKSLPVKSEALGSSVEKTESKTKTTTILGTYSWDVETDTLGSTSKSDFWWERIDTTKGNLVAQNGTTVEVTAKDFASIDKKYIQQFPVLRYGRINYSDIKPGTVVMFKTGEGHYGKLRIKGYRALHDFDFKEAREYLEASWKNFVMHKQDIKSYHLIVEYTLFK